MKARCVAYPWTQRVFSVLGVRAEGVQGSERGELVEAAGVVLFNPLILRKLLILECARNAKKAPLPGRRYKNGTKNLAKLEIREAQEGNLQEDTSVRLCLTYHTSPKTLFGFAYLIFALAIDS